MLEIKVVTQQIEILAREWQVLSQFWLASEITVRPNTHRLSANNHQMCSMRQLENGTIVLNLCFRAGRSHSTLTKFYK